jgi:hypothetical protein
MIFKSQTNTTQNIDLIFNYFYNYISTNHFHTDTKLLKYNLLLTINVVQSQTSKINLPADSNIETWSSKLALSKTNIA